jgi:hypothetical protein
LDAWYKVGVRALSTGPGDHTISPSSSLPPNYKLLVRIWKELSSAGRAPESLSSPLPVQNSWLCFFPSTIRHVFRIPRVTHVLPLKT